jgi:hypothetical protein
MLDFTDLSQLIVDGLTPEIVGTIKESLQTFGKMDFSLLTTAQLTQMQELVNGLRFFMPMILVEQRMNALVRVTKNPRQDGGLPTRIHKLCAWNTRREKTERGRANFPKRPVLYASFFGLTSIVESRVMPGDLLTRTEWRMVTYLDRIRTTAIFHDAPILERLAFFKKFPRVLSSRAREATVARG